MNALVERALTILQNPEHYDEESAVGFFLDLDRGLYVSDLRNVSDGMTILKVAITFLASTKILLDGWKYDGVDVEHGSIMTTYDCIKKMGEILQQFNDYVYAVAAGKETGLLASNLRVLILNVQSFHTKMFNVDIIKMPNSLKFAFLAADAALSQGFHIIDNFIDRTAGRNS